MLNTAIRKKQPGTHGADAGQPTKAHHLTEPSGISDFGIVVQKQEILGRRLPGGIVAKSGEIEPLARLRHANDTRLAMRQELLRPGIIALIVYDDDFEVPVAGPFEGRQTAQESSSLIPRRNENGN